MIQNNSILPNLDPTTERKRVLAKVYRLLLRLAEEAENKTSIPDTAVVVDEHISEPVQVKENPVNI